MCSMLDEVRRFAAVRRGFRFLWILGLLRGMAIFAGPDATVSVCATTGMVADLARGVGGDAVAVHALMGPGVDPHLYKATASDLVRLQRADLILYNGLHLEGRMQETFERLARSGRRVRAVTEGLARERLIRTGAEGLHDPHVWFDVRLWADCTDGVARELSGLRPESTEGFRTRAAAVKDRLAELDRWARGRVVAVPASRRILVTSHDAFAYFCRAYGLRSAAPTGWSTGEEIGGGATPERRRETVASIRRFGVKAIFVETSVNPKAVRAIAADAGVRIGGELYSDSMGPPGSAGETYLGMMRENIVTIVESLR